MDFLPQRELLLLEWLNNFQQKLNVGTSTYGVTLEQAADMQTKYEAFLAAKAVSVNPATRSPLNVELKNVAKADAIALARQLAGIAQRHPGLTDAMRITLGLTVPKQRTPGQKPNVAPSLEYLGNSNRRIAVRAQDPQDPLNRGLAAGVTGVQWYSWIGEEPPADPRDWFNQGATQRARAELAIPGTEAAKVWITAAYFNAHGAGPGQDMLLQVNLSASNNVPVQQVLKIAA
jgi:hypothetical protein